GRDDGAQPGNPGPHDGGSGGGPGGDPRGGDPRGGSGCLGRADDGWRDDLPAPRDEDAPGDDGLDETLGDAGEDDPWDPDEDDDDLAGTGPGPVWPPLGTIPPALARPTAGPADGRPVPPLLDVTVAWLTLAGRPDQPGLRGRIGPITATQARYLAGAADADPATQW